MRINQYITICPKHLNNYIVLVRCIRTNKPRSNFTTILQTTMTHTMSARMIPNALIRPGTHTNQIKALRAEWILGLDFNGCRRGSVGSTKHEYVLFI